MQHGIQLEIAWTDEDFLALSVAGASGRFAGAYTTPEPGAREFLAATG